MQRTLEEPYPGNQDQSRTTFCWSCEGNVPGTLQSLRSCIDVQMVSGCRAQFSLERQTFLDTSKLRRVKGVSQ